MGNSKVEFSCKLELGNFNEGMRFPEHENIVMTAWNWEQSFFSQ